ncbi:melatonin receptor type 1C-like [Clavelina lepadiformis]|uniref:melatonin receptor type 1C-like n=1 Tax=Clavelina lepadiformis TaxID=159417 RepID=UPI004041B009
MLPLSMAVETTVYDVDNQTGPVASATIVPDPEVQFGSQQVVEVVYLSLLAVVGTLGNLLVISSIVHARRVNEHGNVFVINLAIADILVNGVIIPIIIGNVINGGNVLNTVTCDLIGYVTIITCCCSICNLTFIALNRYWAVVHRASYENYFSPKRVKFMVVFIWTWSTLLAFPTLLGWSDLGYDEKMLHCTWDDTKDISYNIFLITLALVVPLCGIFFSYWRLLRAVVASGKKVRRKSSSSANPDVRSPKSRSLEREMNLTKTLAATILAFMVSWGPYGLCVMVAPSTVSFQLKKIFGWLGITNSSMNFVIYGVMNPGYRAGYKKLLVHLFGSKLQKADHRLRSHGLSTGRSHQPQQQVIQL